MIYLIINESEDSTTEKHSKHKHEYKKYVKIHDHHFNNELSEHVSKMMENSNGSKHSWTCEQVKQELMLRNVQDYGHCSLGDITYLANMAYADFFPNVLETEQACIKYAIAVAQDVDGYEGIAFCRWMADVKNKDIEIDWEHYV